MVASTKLCIQPQKLSNLQLATTTTFQLQQLHIQTATKTHAYAYKHAADAHVCFVACTIHAHVHILVCVCMYVFMYLAACCDLLHCIEATKPVNQLPPCRGQHYLFGQWLLLLKLKLLLLLFFGRNTHSLWQGVYAPACQSHWTMIFKTVRCELRRAT